MLAPLRTLSLPALYVLVSALMWGPSLAEASSDAASEGTRVQAFIQRSVPVMPLAVGLIGTATKPEADGDAFIVAIKRVEAQRPRIDAVIRRVETLWRQVLRDGAGGAKGGKRLVRRIDAHAPLRDALSGASLRRAAGTALGGPLGGGRNLGPTFRLLGKLLAGDVVVALSRSDMEQAAQGLVRMVRFGALVADSARTLDELSSGLTVTQEALGVMQRVPEAAFDGLMRGTASDVKVAHRALGTYAVDLQRVRRALSTSIAPETFAALAMKSSSALWRYEAFKALRGAAWSGVGTERGKHAEVLLGKIAEAQSVAEDIKQAALETLAKLKASR
jgi:hypothetical protein